MTAPNNTAVTANLIMKATEPDPDVEVVQNTFWAPLTRDGDAEYEDSYMKPDSRKPTGIINRKTKIKHGQDSIEFGKRLALVGEGKFDGDTLSGNEEKLRNYENRAFFSDVRHGVPFDVKGNNAWTTSEFMKLDDGQRELATWHARYYEQAGWDGLLYGINTRAAAKNSAKVSQSFHPTVYTTEAAGLSRVTWSATGNTYKTNINADRGNLGAGDNINYDRIMEAEIAMADNNIKPIRVSYSVGKGERSEDECWLWVYPRAARKRIKLALKDIMIQADVRGDANRAIRGDIVKFGKFLFMEAAYLPRITGSTTTLTLQNAWSYDATTNSRIDARNDDSGVVHALLGEDALCLAEPEKVSYSYEETDHGYKKSIGSYRMFGFRRNETYDSFTTIVSVMNQSSILLIESNV